MPLRKPCTYVYVNILALTLGKSYHRALELQQVNVSFSKHICNNFY